MFEPDEFDKKILKIVQHNNRTPSEKIAAEIGLSTSAVQRRLQRLRKERVIVADVSIVAPAANGSPSLTAIIGVTLEQEHTAVLNDFKSKMKKSAAVVQCYFVTGEVDFILVISVKDMAEYEKFTRTYLTNNPNIKRYVTNIVISEVKSEFISHP